MVYVPFTLNIPSTHAAAMFHGGSIKVRPSQHNGHKLFVTKGQHARLMKSRKSGRPITLRMTPAQFKYNAKYGSGFWSDAFNKLKQGAQTVYKVAKPVLKPIVEAGVNRLVDAGSKRLTKEAEPYLARAENYINGGELQLYNHDVYNTGPYRRRKSKSGKSVKLYNNDVYNTGAYRDNEVHGEGFFDSVWDGIKTVGNAVAPIAVPIATNVIARRLGGKMKKKKGKKKSSGASLYPVGARP